MNQRTGSCLCGAVRYRITGEPIAARTCWCHDCQRLAANGTVNAIFPSAAIDIDGTTSEFAGTAASRNQLRRRFCPRCGSHLFAESSGRPGFTVVRVGTLDDPSSIRPTANIWSASAPAWACLDPALERVERQPLPPTPPR